MGDENKRDLIKNKILCQCNKCHEVFEYNTRVLENDKDKLGKCPRCEGTYSTIKTGNSRIDRYLNSLSVTFNS